MTLELIVNILSKLATFSFAIVINMLIGAFILSLFLEFKEDTTKKYFLVMKIFFIWSITFWILKSSVLSLI